MSTSAERMRRMRERRAAAIEPAPDAPPRSADELLGPAVAETLASLDLKPEDAAAARLAERYAATIDAARDPAWAARWLGPLLLDSLEALQATPASRKPAKPAPQGPSRLEQLRAARQGPKYGA